MAIGILVAVLFTALILLTGKGDAMSGGGSVRTTFKGKASFDDQISRVTLYLGIGFMVLMLVIDVLGTNAHGRRGGTPIIPPTAAPQPTTTSTEAKSPVPVETKAPTETGATPK